MKFPADAIGVLLVIENDVIVRICRVCNVKQNTCVVGANSGEGGVDGELNALDAHEYVSKTRLSAKIVCEPLLDGRTSFPVHWRVRNRD